MASDDIVWQQNKKPKKYLLWFVIPVCLLLLGGIVYLIWCMMPKDYDKITIINRDELSKISDSDINNFRNELLILLRNYNAIGVDDEVSDVVIREGSEISSTNVDTDGGYWKETTFLIDIDSLKQTYTVKIIESDEKLDGITAQIYCPKLTESKYPESECRGIYYSDNTSIEYRLPYEFSLENGEKVLVKNVDTIKKQGEWKNIVQVYLFSCKDKNPPVEEAEKAVREWVKGTGDEFEFYTYNIRTGYCEGDAI